MANVAARTVPSRFVSSNSVQPEDFDSIDGQKLVVALHAGDPIERGQLERPDRPAFSATLASGERAITFPVDEISSISGMLVHGDIIDLMYTGPGITQNSYGARDPGSSGSKDLLHVRPIMQAVPVLATGKTTQKRVIPTDDGGSKEVNVDFTTVTLQVQPNQAEQILIAQKLGTLTAVLRNPTDSKTAGLDPLDETQFKRVSAGPRSSGPARRLCGDHHGWLWTGRATLPCRLGAVAPGRVAGHESTAGVCACRAGGRAQRLRRQSAHGNQRIGARDSYHGISTHLQYALTFAHR